MELLLVHRLLVLVVLATDIIANLKVNTQVTAGINNLLRLNLITAAANLLNRDMDLVLDMVGQVTADIEKRKVVVS